MFISLKYQSRYQEGCGKRFVRIYAGKHLILFQLANKILSFKIRGIGQFIISVKNYSVFSFMKEEVLITADKDYSFHCIKQYTAILLVLQIKRAAVLVTAVLLLILLSSCDL